MTDFVVPALIGLFLVFGPWVFIVILFNRTKKIRSEIQSLREDVRREQSGQVVAAAAAPFEPQIA